jgi:hypothetical protein
MGLQGTLPASQGVSKVSDVKDPFGLSGFFRLSASFDFFSYISLFEFDLKMKSEGLEVFSIEH